MNLIFVTNARFSKTENGNIYGYHTALNYNSFAHYLKVFNTIKIIARVEYVTNKTFDESIRLNLENVEVLEVPYFIGPLQYFSKIFKIKKTIRNYLSSKDAIICRIPGTLGKLAANEAHQMKKPYGLEVAADPFDVFAPGSFNHPLRKILRFVATSQLKSLLKNTPAAIYVTAKQLQKRYPASHKAFQTHASNVILNDSAFAHVPKRWIEKPEYTIVSIGTLDQMYKAPDILMKAIHKINTSDTGIKVKLQWLGEGKYKSEMQALAKSLNTDENIHFLGAIKPAEKVREYLDNSDLFVLVSRTEGLPRAMVEAMARGLPCIGTKIGGIPELLSEKVLIPINNVDELANRIIQILKDENLYNTLAQENFQESRAYELEKLNQRRFSFYEKVKSLTTEYNHE